MFRHSHGTGDPAKLGVISDRHLGHLLRRPRIALEPRLAPAASGFRASCVGSQAVMGDWGATWPLSILPRAARCRSPGSRV